MVGPEGKDPSFAISDCYSQNQLWEIRACFSLTCGRCQRPGTVILRHLERLLQLQKNLDVKFHHIPDFCATVSSRQEVPSITAVYICEQIHQEISRSDVD